MNLSDMPLALLAVYLPVVLLVGYLSFELLQSLASRFRNFEIIHHSELELSDLTETKPLVHR